VKVEGELRQAKPEEGGRCATLKPSSVTLAGNQSRPAEAGHQPGASLGSVWGDPAG
jgi:hypothetical protein